MSCEECGGDIRRGEKVFATCSGRRITQRKKLEIGFYHVDCWKKRFGKSDFELRTRTEWRKKYRDDYPPM